MVAGDVPAEPVVKDPVPKSEHVLQGGGIESRLPSAGHLYLVHRGALQ
jgi:hypothetical protein